MLRLVVRANARADKLPVLLEVREELEELKVLLRLGRETNALPSMNSFEQAATLVVGIAKQNEGWIKSQNVPDPGRNRPAIPERTAGPGVP